MSNLLQTSKRFRETADNLLQRTNLKDFLSQYGEVCFAGAYAGDVMMHGDIDIYVIKPEPFTIEEIFEIFRKLYFDGKFRSYFIGGDWDDTRKGKEFPKGYYVGLKEKLNEERWKIDIWFVGKEDFEKRKGDFHIENVKLSPEQKEKILFLKEVRNDKHLSITGQTIYKAVLEGEISTGEELIKYVEKVQSE